MPIYDTQSHHGSIPEIEYLSRVAENSQKTDARHIFYSRQRYDTVCNQKKVQRTLSAHLQMLRQKNVYADPDRNGKLIIRLSQLIDHAYLTVPFYRALYRSCGFTPGDIRSMDDFHQLPIVRKSDFLAANVQDLLSSFDYGRTYRSRTSGASGAPLDMIYTDEQYVISMCHYIWQLELALGKPAHPERWLYNIHHARWWLSSIFGQYRTFSINDLPDIDVLAAHLRTLQPQALILLPSYLNALMLADIDLQSFGIKAIITNSEQSTFEERRRHERNSGIPVRDEYSSVELEQIAFECSEGRYHIFEDNLYLEVVNPDDYGIGSIVGTNLYAKKMPMVRYDQTDLGRLSTNRCSCGAYTQSLDQILGRRNASFLSREGRIIPSASLLGIADNFLTRAHMGIRSYKLYQVCVDKLILYYTGTPAFTKNTQTIEPLKAQLERLFGHPLQIAIKNEKSAPATNGYKRQLLVSMIS